MKIAIVGAGMTGLAAARSLSARGARVVLFDKGRGVGGRCASRGRDLGGFDHGAQRLFARSERFQGIVEGWAADGRVLPTHEPGEHARGWLPTPAMNALPSSLATGLEVRASLRVQSLVRRDRSWWLGLEGREPAGPFDTVLVTAPAPQSRTLLAPHGVFVTALGAVAYDPCWALTLACDAGSVGALPDAIFLSVDDPALALVAREGRKPGRAPDGALVRLVVHGSADFSRRSLEAGDDEVSASLLAALRRCPGLDGLRVRFSHAHRWRFAHVSRALGEPFLFDRTRGLGVAGDGLLGPSIEAAWTSGEAAAEEIGD
jgi:predicted NAD/FAD-dependent oxidoreductase